MSRKGTSGGISVYNVLYGNFDALLDDPLYRNFDSARKKDGAQANPEEQKQH